MTQRELDELVPEIFRTGVVAALTVAQREGLISFPEGPFSREEIELRVDLCVGAFIAAVKEMEASHKLL